MELRDAVKLAGAGLLAAAFVEQLRRPPEDRTWYGRIGGVVPYDLRPPTLGRLVDRWWNPGDHRLFTPQVFGVGWSLNVPELLRRLAALGEAGSSRGGW